MGTIGDNLRMDYTAIGDTTNLAARLQQHAEPGTILISEATYRLVRDDVQADRLDPIAVKGKSKPIVPYGVLAAIPRRSPLRGLGERALSNSLDATGTLRNCSICWTRRRQVEATWSVSSVSPAPESRACCTNSGRRSRTER